MKKSVLGITAGSLAVVLAAAAPPAYASPTRGAAVSQTAHDAVEPTGSYAGLYAVDALTTADVWAVGRASGEVGTRIDHWNGTTWTTVDSPVVKDARLEAVDAIAAADVWAVGSSYTKTSGKTLPLAEYWDGNQWDIVDVPLPDPDAVTTSLSGVSAISANDVWAVGTSAAEAVAYHWDGVEWRLIDLPELGQSSFSAVVAVGAKDVWATGGAAGHGLFEHWDGKRWTVVPAPPQGPNDLVSYRGISAADSGDVWAVGGRRNEFSGRGFTITAHWDGATWTQVDSYSTIHRSSRLTAVDVVATDDVWAAGGTGSDFGRLHRELAEHWDGGDWTHTATPKTDSPPRLLYGISAVSSDDVWAVGFDARMHWDGTRWSLAT